MSNVSMQMTTEQRVETIARVCHAANTEWCAMHADYSHRPWDEAGESLRQSVRAGVRFQLAGATPEQMHEEWCRAKLLAGWRYGPTKDAAVKTHPCLLKYDRLPAMDRTKDALFVAVVRSLAPALGLV